MGFFKKTFGKKQEEMSSWDAPIVAKFNEIDGNIEIVRTQTISSSAPFFGFVHLNEYNKLYFGFRKLNGEVILFFQDTVKSGRLKKGIQFKLSFEGDNDVTFISESSPSNLPKVGKSLMKTEMSFTLDNSQIDLLKNNRLLNIDVIREGQLPERFSIPATIAYTDKVTGDAPIQIIRIFRKIASF